MRNDKYNDSHGHQASEGILCLACYSSADIYQQVIQRDNKKASKKSPLFTQHGENKVGVGGWKVFEPGLAARAPTSAIKPARAHSDQRLFGVPSDAHAIERFFKRQLSGGIEPFSQSLFL